MREKEKRAGSEREEAERRGAQERKGYSNSQVIEGGGNERFEVEEIDRDTERRGDGQKGGGWG